MRLLACYAESLKMPPRESFKAAGVEEWPGASYAEFSFKRGLDVRFGDQAWREQALKGKPNYRLYALSIAG